MASPDSQQNKSDQHGQSNVKGSITNGSNTIASRSSQPFLLIAAPIVLVVSPLISLALHSDQRISIYEFTARFGVNPIRVITENIREIPDFISKGNFRPVGRFIFYMEEVLRWELAATFGVPPHIVQGIIRLIMVGLLAWVATRLVILLHRSQPYGVNETIETQRFLFGGIAGRSRAIPSLVELFPPLVASTIVVNHSLHPVSFFPMFLIFVTICILGIPQYIASDKGMYSQGITRSDAILSVLLGLLTPMIYELLYILPVMCILVIILRTRLIGLSIQELISTSTLARFTLFLGSFMTVFIPSRILISHACSLNQCYGNTDLAISDMSMNQWIGRVLTGHPLYEWLSILGGGKIGSFRLGWIKDLAGNVAHLLIVVGFLLLMARIVRRLAKSQSAGQERLNGGGLGLSFIVLGGALVLLPTLMVSLSRGMQEWNDAGKGLHQWRDTLLVQVGWALIMYGILTIIVSSRDTQARKTQEGNPLHTVPTVIAVGLVIALILTFIANANFADYRRSREVSKIVNLISMAAIEFEDTEEGSAMRCHLLVQYSELACDSCWHSGVRLTEQLNNLSNDRYSADFCPVPIENNTG